MTDIYYISSSRQTTICHVQDLVVESVHQRNNNGMVWYIMCCSDISSAKDHNIIMRTDENDP